MTEIVAFDHRFAILLPATHHLLLASHLTVHPAVSQIVLHGSRGLAGSYRTTSDIDLSLLIDSRSDLETEERDILQQSALLQDVLQTTLRDWRGQVKLDLVAIFDIRNCGMKCFDQSAYNEKFCAIGGIDCFGIYKVQRGFNGYVTNAGIQVRRMYPCLRIWQRTLPFRGNDVLSKKRILEGQDRQVT